MFLYVLFALDISSIDDDVEIIWVLISINTQFIYLQFARNSNKEPQRTIFYHTV